MHLIDALASGVTGAENGAADIFARGTSTRVTYYNDFEGLSPQSQSSEISLDANGGVTVYVNEVVDVVVRDSDGVTVRSFTSGSGSPNLEIRSQSFTGTTYDDGAGITTSAASNPVTGQTVMDLWLDQNGAIDWQVLVDGSAKTIQAAIAAFSGMFYNVKDPTYGAEGDGATDDRSAIQAAIDAAFDDGGGIVFFPRGTYQVSSRLDVKDGVAFWGVGPFGSILEINHATNNLLEGKHTNSVGTAQYSLIFGLTLRAAVSNSGSMFSSQTAQGFYLFLNCKFGGGTSETGALVSDGNGVYMDFDRCSFKLADADQNAMTATANANTKISADDCHFYPVTAPSTTIFMDVGDSRVTNCYFHNLLATSGTLKNIRGNRSLLITGCRFEQTGGAATTAISSNTLTSEEKIVEANNYFGSSVTRYDLSAATGDELAVFLGSRQNIYAEDFSTSPIAIDADQFETIGIEWDGGTTVTINTANNTIPRGHRLQVMFHNNHATNTVTITWGSNFKVGGVSMPTVPANHMLVVSFMAGDDNSGTTYWYLQGTPQAVDE